MSITDDKGFYLVTENDSLTAKCNIYKDGNELSDYNGITFKWEKLLGNGNVTMGTSRTQVVANADVDNVLLLRCTATISGSKQYLKLLLLLTYQTLMKSISILQELQVMQFVQMKQR